MDTTTRLNATVTGPRDGQPIVFAHGFGCDQHTWRFVAPRFEDEFRVVLFDYVGFGGSDSSAYDSARYSALSGYADDVIELCHELGLENVIFVGHSVSSMIGVLASLAEPSLFAKLVLVGPSPRYINDDSYIGGFAEADITELLESMESNYLGWSSAMGPVIMANLDRPQLAEELTSSFCRADPAIARAFARATFLSDNRRDLQRVRTPTLILQCANDVIAPTVVGEYVRDAIPNSSFVLLDATGHCPNLSAPEQTSHAIAAFLHASSIRVD